jgi:hypothetical protein
MNIKVYPQFLFLVNIGLVLMLRIGSNALEFEQNQARQKEE